MSTSVNEAAEQWTVDDWRGDTSVIDPTIRYDDVPVDVDEAVDVVGAAAADAESLGTVDAAGISARGLIISSAAAAAACVLLDLALTSGRLSFFFDLCFIVLCMVAAMSVPIADLFTAGVLPPLLFAGVIAVVTLVAPGAIEASNGIGRVFLTGLATHAFGLIAAYAVTLATIAIRIAASRSQP